MNILRILTIKNLTEVALIKDLEELAVLGGTRGQEEPEEVHPNQVPIRSWTSALSTALWKERDSSNTNHAPSTNDGTKTIYASEQGFLASKLSLYMTENRSTLEFWSYATIYSQN